MKKRKVEVFDFNEECWKVKQFEDLKENDIVRMFEPDGTSIILDDKGLEYNIFKVVSGPYDAEGGLSAVTIVAYENIPIS